MGVVSRCAQLSIPIPSNIYDYTERLVAQVDNPNMLCWKMLLFRLQLVTLRSDVRRDRMSDPEMVMKHAKEIDDQTRQGFAVYEASRAHRYECNDGSLCLASPPTSDILLLPVLINRIEAHAVMLEILRVYHPVSAAVQSQIGQELRTISRLSMEFLMSLPKDLVEETTETDSVRERVDLSNIGLVSGTKPSDLPLGYREVVNLATVDFPVLRTVRGHALVWQLALIGKVNPPRSNIRRIACKSIRLLGQALCMSQAGVLADHLENEVITSDTPNDASPADPAPSPAQPSTL